MNYYAQLNEENICFAVSQLSGEVQADNLIKISSFDTSIMGKRYADGTWVEAEQLTTALEPTLTETEQAILDTAINVDYLVCMKELEI